MLADSYQESARQQGTSNLVVGQIAQMPALAAPTLTGTVAAAISDEQILKPNRIAWVTQHFLILRNAERQNHTIIPLVSLMGIDLVKTPYSGLLAIAAGVFIIAAAAFTSKQGDGAAVPCALLGAFLIAVYFGSRRANITFKLDTGATETTCGTLGEATALIQLIEAARRSAMADLDDASDFSTASSASSAARKAPSTAQPVFESSALV